MSFAAELRAEAEPVWAAQHAHPFVRGIGDGSLSEARFRHYVRQDYRFLIDYGRLLSLGAARAPRPAQMARWSELARAVIVDEMDLHRSFAKGWGVAESELEAERRTPATAGYCDFLLRTAALGDFSELVAALLPCMWGYAEIGARLAALPEPGGGHAGYRAWIETYADPEFAQLAAWCREATDEAADGVGHEGRERMRAAFMTSSELELAFWEDAWQAH